MLPRAQEIYWRDGHQIQLLSEGEIYIPAMLAAIAHAQDFILVELYLAQDGRLWRQFRRALIQAALRGVRVYILLDHFGSQGVSRQERAYLAQAGIRLRFFNPLHWRKLSHNLVRNHRKLLLIDGQLAFVGGFGWSDEFLPYAWHPHPQDADKVAWKEVAVQVQGPSVHQWLNLFVHTWQQGQVESTSSVAIPEDFSLALFTRAPHQQASASLLHLGRVVCGQGLLLQGVKRSLLYRILRARERIWIATPYFAPSWRLRRYLRLAARRGVDVRLLLAGPKHDHPAVRYAGQRFYLRLLLAGVRIFEYQPRFTHAKVCLCDTWVSIGSCNFDSWSLHWNLEANQEVLSAEFAQELSQWFARAWPETQEIKLETWRKRSWYPRVRQWWWGRVDTWLTRLTKASR